MGPTRKQLNQFIASRLKNPRVIAAVKKVDRADFVPKDQRNYAYLDSPLPIGYGQTISQPSLVAWMIEQLELKEGERVLEIGTGSGYQAALLAELAKEVITTERIPELAEQARKTLASLSYTNITVIQTDGSKGYQLKAPYDVVVVAAAGPEVPQPLIEQLAEGGRLLIPVGEPHLQNIIKVIKKNGKPRAQTLLPVRFVPLVEDDK